MIEISIKIINKPHRATYIREIPPKAKTILLRNTEDKNHAHGAPYNTTLNS